VAIFVARQKRMKFGLFWLICVPALIMSGPASSGTTTETTTKCSYTTATGKTVFDGVCLANWGVIGLESCDSYSWFRERYVLTFRPGSAVWIYLDCDGSAEVNNIKAKYTTRYGEDDLYWIQVLTEEGELFVFRQITE
jgi:hypothetical protein